MGLKSRKFYIWLISLAAVSLIYLLYNKISKTSQIKIDTGAETVSDRNLGDFDGEIGMVGDVGVGTVQVAKFITLNKNKGVDREFGFEKLLHEVGDQWHIEKPYINIFRRNFKCYVTAEQGKVRVETVVGRPSPKDGKLIGNVVIHILPENGSDIKESFIYLDDLVFISEKSQFSTAGPVKFVSEDALMLGRGLELVYNNELNRLEFLRIIHLESLRLKTSSQVAFFSPAGTEAGTPAGTSSRTQTEPPDKARPVGTDDSQKAKPSPVAGTQAVGQKRGEYYRCVFSKGVVINRPEQLVFADEVSVHNIFWSEASSEESKNEAYLVKREAKATSRAPEPGPRATNHEIQDIEHRASSIEHRASSIEHRDMADEQFVDIVVTCDNGFVVMPMSSARAGGASGRFSPETSIVTGSRAPKDLKEAAGRTTFVAQKIDYCVSTGDTVASGPSELVFYVDDLMGAEAKETTVPVKVTSRKKAKFLSALNRVIFEGDCLCTMLREDANSRRRYTLSAPELTVDLSRDKASAAEIEHLTAAGGVVRLATVKTAGEKLLGGIELKCLKFDYDTAWQFFLATGPGVIKFDNSRIPEPDEEVGRFSLRRPCWALVEDFDTLTYYLEANRIIADAESQQMHIGYVPVIKGRYGRAVKATAGHIEAFLYETADGQSELSTLNATGGVTFEDEGKQFVGSELFYDAKKSIVTVQGDELQPCYLNGVLVDGIKYNLETGKVSTEVVGPGAYWR